MVGRCYSLLFPVECLPGRKPLNGVRDFAAGRYLHRGSELRNKKKPVADFGQIACNLQLSRRLQTQVNDPVVSGASFLQAAPRLGDSVAVVQSILADCARRFLGLERLDLARALSDLALSESKLDADALSVAAHILDRQGEWKKSLAHLWEAHTLSPEAPQGRLDLAMALLRFGDYREGFALYEARVDKKNWSGFATPESRAALRHLKLRPDQPVEGKRILILAEQGLGDGIMFARYIAMLVKRGARVAIACNPTMRPFFERIAGIETVLCPPSDKPFAQINLAALPFDAWTPLLSLAAWFETDVANVPAEFRIGPPIKIALLNGATGSLPWGVLRLPELGWFSKPILTVHPSSRSR